MDKSLAQYEEDTKASAEHCLNMSAQREPHSELEVDTDLDMQRGIYPSWLLCRMMPGINSSLEHAKVPS
jgi:hypothetical protein